MRINQTFKTGQVLLKAPKNKKIKIKNEKPSKSQQVIHAIVCTHTFDNGIIPTRSTM